MTATKRSKKVTVGVIGCGWWGPKLVRCFTRLRGARVKTVADLDPDRLGLVAQRYPEINVTDDYGDILDDPEVDAVCVATPIETHYSIAMDVLEAGKHALIEKPMATRHREAKDMLLSARAKGLTLLIDHTFLYNPAVTVLQKMIAAGKLGDILYLESARINPGPPHARINVLWDLAPHDISICLHLFDEIPESVTAFGKRYQREHLEDVVYLTMYFPSGRFAQIHLSWLSSYKTRLMRIYGSEKTAVYNDAAPEKKITVCSSGADTRLLPRGKKAPLEHSYGRSAISTPAIPKTEPLRNVCRDLWRCVSTGTKPRVSEEIGYHVVCILEAAGDSMKREGKRVAVPTEI